MMTLIEVGPGSSAVLLISCDVCHQQIGRLAVPVTEIISHEIMQALCIRCLDDH